MKFIKELGWHFRRTMRNKVGSYDVRYGQIRGGEQGFNVLLASGQTIYSTDFKPVTISAGVATIMASSAVKFAGVIECEGIPNSVNTGTTTEKKSVKLFKILRLFIVFRLFLVLIRMRHT